MNWTKEELLRLTSLREQGKSFTECAKLFGLSKGSIAGAIYRLKAKDRRMQEDVSTEEPEPEIFNAVVALKHNQCRWPIGDPRDSNFRFCCEHRSITDSYCSAHMQLAYVPVQPRKRIPQPC